MDNKIQINKYSVELIDDKNYEDLVRKCEKAARLCYQTKMAKTLEGAEKFLAKLIKINHGSIIEHESLSFRITTNIATTRELNRHRHNSPNELSTRYVDMSNLPIVLNDSYTNEEIEILMPAFEACQKAYLKFPKKDRDKARIVLPLGTQTKEMVTMNIRQLREVLFQRLSPEAHRDIRDIAYAILDIVYDKYPVFVKDIYEKFNELRPKTGDNKNE